MDTVLGQLLVVLVTLHLLLYGVGMVIGGNDLGSRLNKKLWNFLIGQGRRFLRGILHLVIRYLSDSFCDMYDSNWCVRTIEYATHRNTTPALKKAGVIFVMP